jgi:hypothetical protein
MAVITVYAGTEDGTLQYDHASSWVNAKDATGGTMTPTSTAVTAYIGQGGPTATGGTWRVLQSFHRFDTSAITDTDTVVHAVFSGWLGTGLFGGGHPISAMASYDWGSTVEAADWRTTAQIAALTILAEKDWSTNPTTGARYDFANVNGGLRSVINKTGNTNFIIFDKRTYTNNTQVASDQFSMAAIRSADDTGTTNDPRLVVTTIASGATYFGVYSEGDSNTVGYKADDNSFATRAWSLLTGSSNEPVWYNGAKSGKYAKFPAGATFTGGSALDSVSIANRDNFFYATGSVYSVMLGTIDLLDSITPSQSYDNIKAVWASAKAKGFRIVAHTVPYINSAPVTASILVDQLNSLIRSDPTLYDALVDVNSAYTFANVGISTSDSIHITQSVHATIAPWERDAWLQLHPSRFLINAGLFAGE